MFILFQRTGWIKIFTLYFGSLHFRMFYYIFSEKLGHETNCFSSIISDGTTVRSFSWSKNFWKVRSERFPYVLIKLDFRRWVILTLCKDLLTFQIFTYLLNWEQVIANQEPRFKNSFWNGCWCKGLDSQFWEVNYKRRLFFRRNFDENFKIRVGGCKYNSFHNSCFSSFVNQ